MLCRHALMFAAMQTNARIYANPIRKVLHMDSIFFPLTKFNATQCKALLHRSRASMHAGTIHKCSLECMSGLHFLECLLLEARLYTGPGMCCMKARK